MQGRKVEDPMLVELVLVDGKVEYEKLPSGWFNATKSEIDQKHVSVIFDVSKQKAPTETDVKIIQRAKTLLSDKSKWNKNCNRKCDSHADTYSIFCAMMKAQEDEL